MSKGRRRLVRARAAVWTKSQLDRFEELAKYPRASDSNTHMSAVNKEDAKLCSDFGDISNDGDELLACKERWLLPASHYRWHGDGCEKELTAEVSYHQSSSVHHFSGSCGALSDVHICDARGSRSGALPLGVGSCKSHCPDHRWHAKSCEMEKGTSTHAAPSQELVPLSCRLEAAPHCGSESASRVAVPQPLHIQTKPQPEPPPPPTPSRPPSAAASHIATLASNLVGLHL